MSLAQDQERLNVVEIVAGHVIRAEALPGIDISPLIDALVQFLLQLLEDCPMNKIRQAAEQSAKRPVIRLFWRSRLAARLPDELRAKCPDAAVQLLDAGNKLTADQWSALEA